MEMQLGKIKQLKKKKAENENTKNKAADLMDLEDRVRVIELNKGKAKLRWTVAKRAQRKAGCNWKGEK